MRFIFKISGQTFLTATKALRAYKSLKEKGVNPITIHCNNEPQALSHLLQFVAIEKAERLHNKKQGL